MASGEEKYVQISIHHIHICFQLMDNGDVLAVGLPVHKHAVVAYALDNDHVIAPHHPMVVQIV